MAFKYLFGPVPSRRLGLSLGVDIIPHKTCQFNCVYCESGKTTDMVCERKEYVPVKEVKDELARYLSTNPKLDYITFSGSGEPTLNSGLGEINDYLKKTFPVYKTALITNSVLLANPKVIEEVSNFDLVVPSLDAVSQEVFKKVNRPHLKIKAADVIKGITELNNRYKGRVWLEIFIVPGVNDNPQELELLKNAVKNIKPEKVQINSLDRPGTMQWVRPATDEELKKIAQYFGEGAEIVSKPKEFDRIRGYSGNVEDAVLDTIKRRPSTPEDLSLTFCMGIGDINKHLESLEKQGKIQSIIRENRVFYALKSR